MFRFRVKVYSFRFTVKSLQFLILRFWVNVYLSKVAMVTKFTKFSKFTGGFRSYEHKD